MSEKQAWVTLLTRPSYVAGAIILSYSLRKHGSTIPLIVLVTDGVPADCLDLLAAEDRGTGLLRIHKVDALVPQQTVSLIAQRFADTWTKLRVFSLVEYDTLIFLDADIMIMRPMDAMFDFALPGPDWLGATHACVCNIDHDPWALPDWTPASCPYTAQRHPDALMHGAPITPDGPPTYHLMNSGVFLCHPSAAQWARMLHFLHTSPLVATFKFPDQNFLDEFFRNRWVAVGWQWNAVKTSYYWHRNIWRDDAVCALHYIVDKPWSKRIGGDGVAGYLGRDGATHRWWWDVYEEWEADRRRQGGATATKAVEVMGKYIAPPLDANSNA
ncbi:MAG: hypothetical protein M1826_002999 [Phylliscum demangeonii]|nr:MAG: hypothetical protein M1826_002999 [Phylliscum demangeonii]